MNVFGKRERSWRKARKRGVSPIIATILLVAITVVLAAVLYVLISGLTKGPGNTPLGSAFAAGVPPSNSLIVGAGTFVATGCLTGDYCYVLTIESASSGLTAGGMNFVVKTSTGTTAATGAHAGGFTIFNVVSNGVVAQSPNIASGGALSVSTWSSGGTTQLATTMEIIIDTGSATSPAGTGLTFQALGVGTYSGTISVALP
jgi:archaeal type IV pilus assembly protein PilA